MNAGGMPVMTATFAVTTALALAGLVETPARIAYNATSSAPIGFYRLSDPERLTKGTWVLVHLPPEAERLADQRGYLPADVPALKRLAAAPGARVCRSGAVVSIDGRIVAHALAHDRLGRALPRWQGCHRLAPGQAFLLSGADPAAFDGRYFGPTSTRLILAEARPLWTW